MLYRHNSTSFQCWRRFGYKLSICFTAVRVPALQEAQKALGVYSGIPIRYFEVDIAKTLKFCEKFNIYAYDAYFLQCAIQLKAPLLTLDSFMKETAEEVGITIWEG